MLIMCRGITIVIFHLSTDIINKEMLILHQGITTIIKTKKCTFYQQNYTTSRIVNTTSRNNNNSQNDNEIKNCRICEQLHSSRNCPLTIEQRKQEILRKRLCYNCLSNNHLTKDCPMKKEVINVEEVTPI